MLEQKVFALLKRSQLKKEGHVHRIDDTRIQKLLLHSEHADGSRKRGRPRLRCKDTQKYLFRTDPDT